MKTKMWTVLAITSGILASSPKLSAQTTSAIPLAADQTQETSQTEGNIEQQMKTALQELQQLREENRELQKRVSDLERGAGSKPSVVAAQPVKSYTEQPAPPPTNSAPVPASTAHADLPAQRLIQPFGTFGMQYLGLFNNRTPSGYSNIYNQPQVLGRFGVKGELGDRISYLIRFSTGISTVGGNPWVSFADPGDRRYVGFDQYNVSFAAVKGAHYNQTIIAGKVADLPTALGTTELLVDQDFGLPLIADLSSYKVNSKAQIALLTSVGFVTNAGANVGNAFARQLHPVVAGVNGLISDLNQNGPPRANAFLAQLAGDYAPTPSIKLRGSFSLLNVSHANDVPLFEGATGLLGIDGLRLSGMPDGISTNLPAILPVDSNGIVPITGNTLATALVNNRDASAYHILDTFGGVTVRADSRFPVHLFAEWSHNLGAGSSIPGPATPGSYKAFVRNRGDGLVLGFDVGSVEKPKQYSLGYEFVLIQADAMLDYVNNDMWHTNIRGHDFKFKYSANKYVTPFLELMVGQNADGRLAGFSSLAVYPVRNLIPGEDPWMIYPRAGILFQF